MTRHHFLPFAVLLPLVLGFECTHVATAAPSSGQAPPPRDPPEVGVLALRTDKVVIFKDGHGLFIKSAQAVADAHGRVFTENVPEQAVLGTFWAVPDERALRSTVAAWHESVKGRTEERSCLSTLELLRANKGKQLTLTIGEREVTARLLDVLEASGGATAPNTDAEGAWEKEIPLRGSELVAVETAESLRQVFPVSTIRTVAGRELVTHCVQRREVATRTRRLTFDFGPDAANKPVSLHLMYFTPGVRWIPTYRVKTGAGSKAEVSLQAEILNEEENFDSATVDLVVGVPSFKFASTTSPLSLERAMRGALSQSMPALLNSNLGISNASFNLRSGERFDGTASAPTTELASIAAELGGETRQDLFVYPVKGLSLARGARAVVPLWKREVPQRHVYTADLSDEGWQREGPLAENKVLHQLELTNDTDLPFTTGAAMLTDGDMPLGQDVLAYTSPGSRTLVPITTALNLRAMQSHTELQRTPNATSFDGRQYSLITRRSKVTVSNLQRTPVTLRVSVTATGKISNATRNGDVKQTDTVDRVNPRSVVTWEVTLAPGARMELGYDLAVYL